jgi:enoyl-CoA hydratase
VAAGLDEAIALAKGIAGARACARRGECTLSVTGMDELALARSGCACACWGTSHEYEGDRSDEQGPERAEFNRIRREQGLQAAIAWRDSRFGRKRET